jgi:hypothetical protein
VCWSACAWIWGGRNARGAHHPPDRHVQALQDAELPPGHKEFTRKGSSVVASRAGITGRADADGAQGGLVMLIVDFFMFLAELVTRPLRRADKQR